MERNGGMVELGPVNHAHNSQLKSQLYCKPCKLFFGHPSMRGANLMKGLVVHIKAWLVQGVSEVRCRSIPTCSLLRTFG